MPNEEYSLTVVNDEYDLTVVNGTELTLTLSGPAGPAGATGAAGPNTITTATTTPLVGFLSGNGTTVTASTSATFGSLSVAAFNSGSVAAFSDGTIKLAGTSFASSLNFINPTSVKTITLPDATGTVALINDPRFTDERTPLAHTHVSSDIVAVTSQRLIGRHAGGTGAAQEVQVGDGIEFQGSGIRRSALTGDITAAAGSNATTLAATIAGDKIFNNDVEVLGNINANGNMFLNGEQVATVVDPVRTTLTGNGSSSVFAISGASGLVNPSSLIVAIDGALQEPVADYTVASGNITFTSPLANGAKAVVIAPTNVLQTAQMIPSDGSVTSSKLDTNLSLSGQFTLAGQAATTANSAMTRGLLLGEIIQHIGHPITWRAAVTSGTVGVNVGVTDGMHWAISLSPTSGIGAFIQRSTRYMAVLEMASDANMTLHMRAAANLGSKVSLRLGISVSSNLAGTEARILIGVPHGTKTLAAAGYGIIFTTANACKLQIHNGTDLDESGSFALPYSNNGSTTSADFLVTLDVTTAGIGTITLYQRVQATVNNANRRWALVGTHTTANVLPTSSSGGHIVCTIEQIGAASIFPAFSCFGCSAFSGVIITPN